MKQIMAREFKDLSDREREKAIEKATNEEVEFMFDCLNADLEKGRITEEEYYKELNCSKSYVETTGWFVPSCYYEHYKREIDEDVMIDLEKALFDINGNRVYF